MTGVQTCALPISLAEIERENISIRIKASKKVARQERRHQGGHLETGYQKDENGKLVPNEKEFVILQSMFHLRKSGLGYRKISDEVKKKFGRTIYFPQVHKILNREHNQKTFGVVV